MTRTRHDLTLRRQPAEVARARRHVAEFFGEVDSDVRSTLQVLTSELVTNAIVHGDDDIVLRTSMGAGKACVEVLDGSPQAPKSARPAVDAEGGRGLVLLEALAQEWGVRRLSGRPGKGVWFTLEV